MTLLTCVALLAGVANADEARKIKFPVKLDRAGYLGGFWDVGACYVSGQPTEDAFRKLAEEGVKTVICLRGVEEMNDRSMVTFDEAAFLKGLNITYIHIPVGTEAEYSPAAIDKFAKAIGEAKGKVLLHCTVAWRASYVWANYLHKYQKMSLDESIKVGESMNMTVNRVGALLGSEISYDQAPKKTGSPAKISKPASGNKLSLTAPKPFIGPDPNSYMAFTAWDLGDVINASQPDEAQLKSLASKGVKTIINIRTKEEMDGVKRETSFDEEAVAKSLGMTYVNIPIQAGDTFTPKNLALIHEALQNSTGRTLFHCFTANRTSTIWVAYLVKYYGVPLNDAVRHGTAMRFNNVFESFLGDELVYKIKPGAKKPGCGDNE